eukprot:7355870-Prymnesium_polylepis.1
MAYRRRVQLIDVDRVPIAKKKKKKKTTPDSSNPSQPPSAQPTTTPQPHTTQTKQKRHVTAPKCKCSQHGVCRNASYRKPTGTNIELETHHVLEPPRVARRRSTATSG